MNVRVFSLFSLLLIPSTSSAVSSGDTSSDAITNILLSGVLSAIISAIVAFAVARMSRFADTVTKVRNEYIKEFREMAACFLTCASSNSPSKAECDGKSLEYYYYHLMLMLNPAKPDAYWEKNIINQLTEIVNISHEQPNKKMVQDLTPLLQADLDLEWHGMMEEGRRGVLTKNQKENIKYEYYMNYIIYCKKTIKRCFKERFTFIYILILFGGLLFGFGAGFIFVQSLEKLLLIISIAACSVAVSLFVIARLCYLNHKEYIRKEAINQMQKNIQQ